MKKRIMCCFLVMVFFFSTSISAFAGNHDRGDLSDRSTLLFNAGKAYANLPGAMFGANYSKARVLYDLGLFRGRSAAQFEPELQDGANRAEAIVLIGRALGWTVDTTITSVPGYTDIPAYAAPYIQYALDHNITKGTGHKRFGSNLPVSARMVYTWYARALLYSEDVWSNPQLLAKIGLLSEAQAAKLAAIDDDATRDLIVGILFDSLQWKMRGSNQRLIQRLVNSLWVNRDEAEDSGLLNPVSTLTFTAKALSGKVIQLDFSQAIDAATVLPANMEIRAGTPAVTVTAYTMSLSNKTLLITLDSLLPGGTSVTVKPLPGLKSVSGLSTNGASKTVKMTADTTAPRITQATAISNNGIRLTFSEPITSTATEVATHVFLDGQLLAGTPAFSSGNQEWTLVLPSGSVLAAGNHALVVTAGIRDASGLESASTSMTISVAAEQEAPSILEVSVLDRTHLNIRFSEAVKPGVGTLILGALPSGKDQYPVPASLLVDGTLAAITLEAPLPATADTQPLLLAYTGIEDLLGNKVREEKHLSFTAPNDTVAPLASTVTMSGNTIDITFSEPIDGFDATDFTLTGAGDAGSAFTPVLTGTVYDAATLRARITLDAASIPEGTATLTLVLKPGILDLSVNQNASVEASHALTYAKDTTRPVAIVTTTAGFTIEVAFDEAIDGFTKDDFALTGVDADNAALDLPEAAVTVSLDSAGRVARLVIAEAALGEGENTLTLSLKASILDRAAVPNALAPSMHVVVFEKP